MQTPIIPLIKRKLSLRLLTSNPEAIRPIMKLKIILFTLTVILSGTIVNRAYSQEARISLSVKDKTLELVMDEIEMQTEYYFIFNQKQIDVTRLVTITADNKSLTDVLKELFRGTDVNFMVFDRKILLTPDSTTDMLPAVTGSKGKFTVRGTVSDGAAKATIPGANVIIRGTTQGVITNLDGAFQIEVPDESAVLQVSYIGYVKQDIPVGSQRVINVELQPGIELLNEVVVIGYGTTTREKITSSIITVDAAEMKSGVTSNPIELIKGKVPGLAIVNQAGNDPNSDPQVTLRGIGTISASSGPLVIIDGVYSTISDLSALSPNDIESFNILKDGASTAIYGTRGSNGVIIVETKSGLTDKTNVEYTSYYFTERPVNRPEMLNAKQYIALLRTQGYTEAETNKGFDTYWFDELLQNKLSYFQGLSFSNSQKNSSVRLSVGKKDHHGLAIDTYNKTTNFRINLTQNVLDKIDFNAIVSGSRTNQKLTNFNAFDEALKYDPTAPVYNEDGTFYELPGVGASNPLALLKQIDNNGIINRFNGSLEANIDITGNLDLNARGSSSIKNIDNSVFEHIDSRNSVISGVTGNATKYAEFSIENVFELLTNYSYSSGLHDAKLMGGYSFIENEMSSSYMSNSNFLTNAFGANNIGAGTFIQDGKATIESTRQKSRLIAFFGRVNYTFNTKYLFNASLRREGASVFGANNKWGWFPAISAGWRLSEEDFIKQLNLFTQLKLRAGYGITGRSQGIPLYQSLARIGHSGNAFYNGQWIGSYGPTENPNPDLRWEKTKEFNIGVDYSMLKNRLNGTIDVYNRLTVDLLGNFVTQTPPSIEPNIFANVGTIENKGIELSMFYNLVQERKFGIDLGVNYSRNMNEVLSLSNDKFKSDSILYADYGNVSSSLYILAKGLPLGTFYGFKAKGIDSDGNWVFEDLNGDGVIEETVDFTTLGNGLPEHLYSLTLNFRYSKMYLNVYFVGAAGFDVFNAKRLWYENTANAPSNYFSSILESPNSELDDRLRFSDYYLEKGDYLRLDNITLGYNFDNIRKIKMLNVYFTATNIINLTGYSGFDPEVGSGTIDGLTPGWDQQAYYPRSSTYQLGLNVHF